MTKRAAACFVLASAVLLWPLTGTAQPESEPPGPADAMLSACERNLSCAGHLQLANKFYVQENYSAAISEYQAAYQIYPYKLILFNIGRIFHKSKNYPSAIEYYRRYLDTGHRSRASRAGELLEQAKQQQASGEPAAKPPTAGVPAAPEPAGAGAVALATPSPIPSLNRPPLPESDPEYEPPPAPLAVSLPTAISNPASPPIPSRGRGAVPVYRKWWFWTAVGGAAAGIATAVGVGLLLREPAVAGLPADTLIFQR